MVKPFVCFTVAAAALACLAACGTLDSSLSEGANLKEANTIDAQAGVPVSIFALDDVEQVDAFIQAAPHLRREISARAAALQASATEDHESDTLRLGHEQRNQE